MPPFAFLDAAQSAFAELVRGLLLVAGGFLVGYLCGWVLGWAVGRWAFRLKDTTHLKALGRPIGGVVGALIVALMVLTGRGKPVGDGGDGKGSPDANATPGKSASPDPDTRVKTNVPPAKKDVKPADVILRVTVLGGTDVVGERFYLLDDDREAKTFAELKAAVTARKGAEKGKVTVAVLFPTRNVLSPEHPAVTQLTKWATQEAGVDVTFPAGK